MCSSDLAGKSHIDVGIEGGSKEAIAAVPVLAFFVAVWLLVFYLCRAGKLVNYISAPVMGGFISGICTTIILMQVPKLFGGKAGVGELPELVHHIWESRTIFHLPSLLLGVGTLVILLVSKKLIPKFPMAVFLMAAGAIGTAFFHLEDLGIQTLAAVKPDRKSVV